MGAGEKLLAALVMLTKPCSLFESTRIPDTSSLTRNLRSSGRNVPQLHELGDSFPHFGIEVRVFACFGEG